MTENEIIEMVNKICKAFEKREFNNFISLFSDDVVFEIPFSAEGGTRYEGLSKIKTHFEGVNTRPWVKLVQLNRVSARVYVSTTPGIITVEYFSEGTSLKAGNSFTLQTSIAVIQIAGKKIVHYKDFLNVNGIAKIAGA
ncbi:MAG TPA: nuclear transport factor 2 family protein [Chitinophagaceae bacterium]|nr:nuclear transport factor 2 family protein [Chitinophagaceae bacterium]